MPASAPDTPLFEPDTLPTPDQLARGLRIERVFSTEGQDPFDSVEWETRDAVIKNPKGEAVFEQRGVEFPKSWSPLATNVVASKYFYGDLARSGEDPARGGRERSLRQLIHRVTRTITDWGLQQHYFATKEDAERFYDELTWLCLHQYGSFNSPVWFNVGLFHRYGVRDTGGKTIYGWDRQKQEVVEVDPYERPQASACFIISVDDSIDDIWKLMAESARLFKFGSGVGADWSKLRSSKEKLSGGGVPSGPVSFMRVQDATGGTIKSGGKTRRAAIMQTLRCWHPDIEEFVLAKQEEEKKAWALIEQGYDGSFNGPAYGSVAFQNVNQSVRVTDAFMQAVERGEKFALRAVTTGEVVDRIDAGALMKKIAEGTWICGDPGLQYEDTIQRWNTVKAFGPINSSNPCSEFMHPDNTACNLASLNLRKFQKEDGTFDVERFRAATRIFITAMEILVDNAGYPSKQIAYNSHLLRPLGLGFANLGALLMAMGLPYDSDEGRAVAGAIMAIEHCEAYARSAEIAANKKIGPFPAYPENAESMLEVMRMHRAAVEDIHPSCPAYLKEAARQSAARMIALGERHGYRNAQATVLAPTGCLVGGSLVSTDRGLVRLTSLGDPHGAPWQDTSFRVFTDEGVKEATKFYVNGIALTRKIRTRSGYSIQGTHQHRIKVIDPETGHWVWKRFSDITPGDIVPMAMNTLIGEPREVTLPPLGELYWTGDHRTGVPRTVSPDLAELVGYFMGDGSLHAKGLRFCVSEQDEDVVARLRYLVETLFGLEAHVTPKQGYVEVGVHSVPLALWWEACGFAKRPPSDDHTGKGYMPFIPDALLHTNDPGVYQAFLRGLFEADGTLLEGVPALCTAHEAFAQEIQSLLLALGYPTHTRRDQGGWGDTTYVLRLKNRGYNDAFAREIGFIGGRKREAVAGAATRGSAKGDRIYVDRALVEELVPAGSTHRDAVLLSLRRHGAVPRQRLEQIYKETRDERLVRYMGYFYDVVEANEDGGEQLTYDLSVPENVTYVANGFISHNTIAFMMDCDTTGIEPDIALVKYKLLAGKGDGMLKIVNRTVPEALRRLGYDEEAIERIVAYIDEHDTIEGAPDLKEEHLPVFDCAFKPFKGTRSIHHSGHLKMMAACQPFISGAISKTVNMPEHSTVEDIVDAYMLGWKLGLKAVAIYRENSKRSQPLATSKGGNTKGKEVASGDGMATESEPQIVEKVVEKVVYQPVRKRLPDERPSIAHKFSIAGHEGYLHIGLYPDTKMPGEIFITMAKQGSTISGLMDAFATSISLALQYGVPLEDLCNKFSHMRFEPSGFTNNRQIPIAKSIMDYIFRYLSLKFLGQMKEEDTVNPKQAVAEVVDRSGPATDEKQMDMFEGEQKPVDALVGSTVEAFFEAAERAHATQASIHVEVDAQASFKNQEDAPPCPNCGSITVRSGACYACPNCGSSSGCG